MAHLSGNDDESVDRDTDNSPQSENETRALQDETVHSETVHNETGRSSDADAADADVSVLPGTGGPDDFGDISVSDDELNL
jgi:hypothetical protein